MTMNDTSPTEDELRENLQRIAAWATPTAQPDLPDLTPVVELTDLESRRSRTTTGGTSTRRWLAAAAVLVVVIAAATITIGGRDNPEGPTLLSPSVHGALDQLPDGAYVRNIMDVEAIRQWQAEGDLTDELESKLDNLLGNSVGLTNIVDLDFTQVSASVRAVVWLPDHGYFREMEMLATEQPPEQIAAVLLGLGFVDRGDGRFIHPDPPPPPGLPDDVHGAIPDTFVVADGFVSYYPTYSSLPEPLDGESIITLEPAGPSAAVTLLLEATPNAVVVSTAEMVGAHTRPFDPAPRDDVGCGSAAAAAFGPEGYQILVVAGDQAAAMAEAPEVRNNVQRMASEPRDEEPVQVTGARTDGSVVIFDLQPGRWQSVFAYPWGSMGGDPTGFGC